MGADPYEGWRDSEGKLLKGCPGGPGKNPMGAMRRRHMKLLEEATTDDDAVEVWKELIRRAKTGEQWAVVEFLNRILGKAIVPVDLTSDGMVESLVKIIQGVDPDKI